MQAKIHPKMQSTTHLKQKEKIRSKHVHIEQGKRTKTHISFNYEYTKLLMKLMFIVWLVHVFVYIQ